MRAPDPQAAIARLGSSDTVETHTTSALLEELHTPDVDPEEGNLGATLLRSSWFGFDLDDTLHEFRKASRGASYVVFQHVSDKNHISIDELAATYAGILKQKTADAFTDGRSADSYRQERFRALLDAHDIATNNKEVVWLATLHKDALASALQIKPGALDLLLYLRSIGKKVVVVTEGPEDAQEWTIEKLGLREYVASLATTNEFRKAKVDGLFRSVVALLGIEGDGMVYVGDSFERDVLPARREGILAIHLSEAEDVMLDAEGVRVDSLVKIQQILELGRDSADGCQP